MSEGLHYVLIEEDAEGFTSVVGVFNGVERAEDMADTDLNPTENPDDHRFIEVYRGTELIRTIR